MKTTMDFEKYIANRIDLARKAVADRHLVMNHICIRVSNLKETEKLLHESFGINEYTSLDVGQDKVYPGEKKLSRTWIADGLALELMEPYDNSRYDFSTGEGLPIGYLSEIGFFTPDLDAELERLEKLGWHVSGRCETKGARMVKIDTNPPSGVPVELIQVLDFNEYIM